MSKTKKFEDFIKNTEIGLDLTNNKKTIIDLTKYSYLNESYDPEALKVAAENMGLDLTKNLSKRIDLI